MKLKFRWEIISESTWRAKVYRGWVLSYDNGENSSMVFIEDPTYEWELEPYEIN